MGATLGEQLYAHHPESAAAHPDWQMPAQALGTASSPLRSYLGG